MMETKRVEPRVRKRVNKPLPLLPAVSESKAGYQLDQKRANSPAAGRTHASYRKGHEHSDVTPVKGPSPSWVLHITKLDFGGLEDMKSHVFSTGRLAKWICHFENLAILSAARMGIIVLEPWLVGLSCLRELYFEHNLITTWPHFLKDLPYVEIIRLDGNPCLEKAFLKSPTLRSWFFNWNASNESVRIVPKYIRGIEWPPAVAARSSSSFNVCDLGFFCGGIYTLGHKASTSYEEDLLTPLEPHPLMKRLAARESLGASPDGGTDNAAVNASGSATQSYTDLSSSKSSSIANLGLSSDRLPSRHPSPMVHNGGKHRGQELKETHICLEIFGDIHALLTRHKFPTPSSGIKRAYLVGNEKSKINRLLTSSTSNSPRLSTLDMQECASMLVREEIEYNKEMEFVVKQFYNAKTSTARVSECLRQVFKGFPAMRNINREILGSFRRFADTTALKHRFHSKSHPRQDKMSEHYQQSLSTINESCFRAAVCMIEQFRRLKAAYTAYAQNLCYAELLLDLPSAPMRLYEDEEFESYLGSLVMRFSGLNANFASHLSTHVNFGRISFKGSPGSSSPRHPSMPSSPEFTNSSPTQTTTPQKEAERRSSRSRILDDWFKKQLRRRNSEIRHHPMHYLYLPLFRLVRYERFFKSYSITDPSCYHPVFFELSKLRQHVVIELQNARRTSRCRVLAEKFKTRIEVFTDYRWDAVLAIRSRGYLEKGLLSKNTNDVIDYTDESMSFVKEAFSRSRMRVLRLVRCASEIYIWDEVLEYPVGKCHKSKMVAFSSNDHSHPFEVRLVFLDVMETCLAEVKDFKALYFSSQDFRSEFLEMCQCDAKIMF